MSAEEVVNCHNCGEFLGNIKGLSECPICGCSFNEKTVDESEIEE